jgi:hypothetical protein
MVFSCAPVTARARAPARGYGDLLEREPWLVSRDVEREYITAEDARRTTGGGAWGLQRGRGGDRAAPRKRAGDRAERKVDDALAAARDWELIFAMCHRQSPPCAG